MALGDLPVPPPVDPMLATLSRRLPVDDVYRYEPKWDGFRCVVFRAGAETLLLSGNRRPFDRYFPELDRGPPATVVECCRVAVGIRDVLADLGLRAWPKTKAFARGVALLLERRQPDAVTSLMPRANRAGKVFVDWSQNDFGKSTVAPYSLRGWNVPTVSTPVTWEEVAEVAESGDPSAVMFLADAALARADDGDLFAPVLSVEQPLPRDLTDRAATDA